MRWHQRAAAATAVATADTVAHRAHSAVEGGRRLHERQTERGRRLQRLQRGRMRVRIVVAATEAATIVEESALRGDRGVHGRRQTDARGLVRSCQLSRRGRRGQWGGRGGT
jgi:hypothetical protein